MIDIHRHILPGLDDGPVSQEEAIEIIKFAWSQGITQIIATPHSDGTKLTPQTIVEGCTQLNERLFHQGVDVRILPGSEVQLTAQSAELLRDKQLLTVNNGEAYVLVELPGQVFPRIFLTVLNQIKSIGITPILAHPERYRYLCEQKQLFYQIRQLGVLFQLNVGSLLGYFGKKALRNSQKMVKEGCCDLLGSDCHGIRLKRPEVSAGLEPLKRLKGEKAACQIIYENPYKLLLKRLRPAGVSKRSLLDKFFCF